MGTTALLSQLSATTELLVIDRVTQQDPDSDPPLSCGCYFRLPQTLVPPRSGNAGALRAKSFRGCQPDSAVPACNDRYFSFKSTHGEIR
jgi:hypothetical protein